MTEREIQFRKEFKEFLQRWKCKIESIDGNDTDSSHIEIHVNDANDKSTDVSKQELQYFRIILGYEVDADDF